MTKKRRCREGLLAGRGKSILYEAQRPNKLWKRTQSRVGTSDGMKALLFVSRVFSQTNVSHPLALAPCFDRPVPLNSSSRTTSRSIQSTVQSIAKRETSPASELDCSRHCGCTRLGRLNWIRCNTATRVSANACDFWTATPGKRRQLIFSLSPIVTRLGTDPRHAPLQLFVLLSQPSRRLRTTLGGKRERQTTKLGDSLLDREIQ